MSNENKELVVTTAIEQAFIVLAKNEIVVAADVFYPASSADQAPFVQIEPVVDGATSDATRINALAAVIQVIDAIPEEYTRFTNVYAPNVLVQNMDAAKQWIQRFKSTNAVEAKRAEVEGRKARPLNSLKVKVGKDTMLKVPAEEIMMWQELFLQLGMKPFINVYNTKAAYQFQDKRKDMNTVRISEGWNKLAELGADIKEFKRDTAESTSERIQLGFAARVATEAKEDNVG